MTDSPPIDRARLGWWLFVLGLAVVAALVAYSFAGILVLGIFGYYATRPIDRRLSAVVGSDDVAAWTTVVLVLLPLIALLFYAGFQIVQQAQGVLGGAGFPYEGVTEMLPAEQRQQLLSAIENPERFVSEPGALLGVVAGAASLLSYVLLVISLAITLTAFLLTNDAGLAAGFRQLVGGRDTTAYAYASAVDEDFASVFFGNFLFVLAMAGVATAVYWGTNLLAPSGLRVPMVFVLGFLTGVASLIPALVGKVVYVPVIGYLGLQAVRTEASLAFVGAVFAGYFVLLDFLPQTFLQPYLTGRQLDTVMMMFGYLLGPILFGWYGFFLLPMMFILMLEAVRIVVPDLVHGRLLTSAVEMGDDVGTTPREERDTVPEDGATSGSSHGPDGADDSADGPSEDSA